MDGEESPVNGNGSKLKSEQMPEKFLQLDQFFTELCTNYGKGSSFAALNVKKIMDIFIICTR